MEILQSMPLAHACGFLPLGCLPLYDHWYWYRISILGPSSLLFYPLVKAVQLGCLQETDWTPLILGALWWVMLRVGFGLWALVQYS